MRQLNIAAIILHVLRWLLDCGLSVSMDIQYTSRVSRQCRLPQWFMLFEHVSQINCAYKCAWTPCCSHLSYNNGNQNCALSAVSLNLTCAEDSSGWSLHQLLDGPVVSRAAWGARQAKKVESLKTPVSVVIIHHSNYVDVDCQTKQTCSKEMRELQKHHMDNKGRDDIEFNFVVGTDGRAYEGRGWDIRGQNQESWNDVALSFSIMGDYNAKQPDTEVTQTLKHVIDCGVKLGKVTSDYKVYGHRDLFSGTACPGGEFHEVIKAWEHYDATTPVKPTPLP